MKIKNLLPLALLVLTTGCSSLNLFEVPTGETFGFVTPSKKVPPTAVEELILEDALAQLELQFSPAHTKFIYSQGQTPSFEKELIGRLRENGYAIWEPKKETAKLSFWGSNAPQKSEAEQFKNLIDPGNAFAIVYSPIKGTNLVQLTLKAGPKTMSRAYVIHRSAAYPVAAWAVGE